MTRVTQGWPFLVARGRQLGYRTILAPPFLPGERAELLARMAGALADGTTARIVEVEHPHAGALSVVYRSERLTGADLAGSHGDELLTDDRDRLLDEHGRPLQIVYGVVARDRLSEPLHPDDLAAARTQAIASYTSFLGDEDGHRVETSVSFALRTAGRQRAVRGVATTGDVSGARPRPATRRRVLGGAAALGAALLAGALLIGQPPARNRDKPVDPVWLTQRPNGTVRLCAMGPPSAAQRRSVRNYNRAARGSKAVLVTLVAVRDPARAGSAELLGRGARCDIVALDIVHLARLASQHLLYDMTPYLLAGARSAAFDPHMLRTARYDGRLWGVPKHLDAAVLYYRADRVHPPRSWPDVYRQARPQDGKGLSGLRLGAGDGEGMTVAFLELAYAAGAQPIVSADGRTAHVDQPQAREALAFLRDAIRDRVMPPSDGGEQGSASVYEHGRVSFLRGPASLARALLQDTTASSEPTSPHTLAGNTALVALPPWHAGGSSVSILTGDALVIPRAAPNPIGALRLVGYLTSAAQVRMDAREEGLLPVRRDVARDSGAATPSMLRAIDRTRLVTRPQIPRYAEVSAIVSAGIRAALRRPTDRATLALIDRAVQRVLDRDPT